MSSAGLRSRGPVLADPVVCFEVIGMDPGRLPLLRRAVRLELRHALARREGGSEPDSYGFVDLLASEDGTGIRGGAGGAEGYPSYAVSYVGDPDVEAALQRAESLGGTRAMGPPTSPNGLVVGHFTDPESTLIGVAGVV